MTSYTITVNSKGEIVIPSPLREVLGWHLGEILAVRADELGADRVILRPFATVGTLDGEGHLAALAQLVGAGVVQLPNPIRQTLGLRHGDHVRLEAGAGSLRISPLRRQPTTGEGSGP